MPWRVVGVGSRRAEGGWGRAGEGVVSGDMIAGISWRFLGGAYWRRRARARSFTGYAGRGWRAMDRGRQPRPFGPHQSRRRVLHLATPKIGRRELRMVVSGLELRPRMTAIRGKSRERERHMSGRTGRFAVIGTAVLLPLGLTLGAWAQTGVDPSGNPMTPGG